MIDWFHRTCEHSVAGIEEAGLLRPKPHPFLGNIPLVWLTSQRGATRAMLGLTSHTLDCDRMAHLYRVLPEDHERIDWWGDVCRDSRMVPYLPGIRRLQAARGTRPGLWGVTPFEVHVERLE